MRVRGFMTSHFHSPTAFCPALLIVILLSTAPLQGFAQRHDPPSKTVWILTGLVRDAETLLPIASAQITVPTVTSRLTAKTDNEGRYRLEQPYPALPTPVNVQVFFPGSLPEYQTVDLNCPSVVARVGETAYCRQTLDFELRRADRLFSPTSAACFVAGTVSGQAKEPVAGAQVSITSTPYHATSDAQGQFTLARVRPGLHLVTAEAMGRFRVEQLMIVACNNTDQPLSRIRLRLMPAVIY